MKNYESEGDDVTHYFFTHKKNLWGNKKYQEVKFTENV